MTAEKRKATATHLFFEIKKLKVKTEQSLKLAVEAKEKKTQEKYLQKIETALQKLEKYI